MSTPSIKVGQGNWGIKAGNLLGYANTEKKFSPVEFTSTRASNTATRVNASGNIEIVNANIPRIDYFGGQASLLVEPAATNLVPNGVGFNVSTGVQTSGVTDSPAVAISGMLATKNEASGTIRYANQTFSATALASGTTYSVSRFFKYNGVEFTTSLTRNDALQWGSVGWQQVIVLSAASGVTLGASTLCTGSIENFGNGWYRVNVRVTTGATIGGAATVQVLSILPADLSTGQGFLIACPQLETGSVATSYIPTTTGTVTRNADVISVTGIAGLIGQTQGTLYLEAFIRKSTDAIVFSIMDTGITESVYLQSASNGNLTANIRSSGTTITIAILAANWSEGYHKVAIAYGAGTGNSAICIDGGIPVTGTVVNVPACNKVFLGSRPDVPGTLSINDRIRAASIYQTRLPNTTTDGSPSLQSITTL